MKMINELVNKIAIGIIKKGNKIMFIVIKLIDSVALRQIISVGIFSNSTIERMLAERYKEGIGCEQNLEKALIKFNQAANAGDSKALTELAYANQTGETVQKNDEEAIKLYEKAINRGSVEAKRNLGATLLNMKRDEKRGEQLLRDAAKLGDIPAMISLGKLYNQGTKKIPKNFREAQKFIRPASNKGNPGAQLMLGIMYMKGNITGEPEVEIAKTLIRKSAKQKNIYAIIQLGSILEFEKNYIEAFQMYKSAAELGNQVGQSKTSQNYEKGRGVPKDTIEAHAWSIVANSQYGDWTNEYLKHTVIEGIEKAIETTQRIPTSMHKIQEYKDQIKEVREWKNDFQKEEERIRQENNFTEEDIQKSLKRAQKISKKIESVKEYNRQKKHALLLISSISILGVIMVFLIDSVLGAIVKEILTKILFG